MKIVLEKYEIWEKSAIASKNNEPVYNKKYLKTEIKS